MGLSRDQIEHWNPDSLGLLADAMDQLGGRLEGHFDEYVNALTKVNGQYWEGRTAEAALDRAHSDRKEIQRLVDDVATVTADMRAGQGEISAALRNAQNAIHTATEQPNGFQVSPDLKITDPKPNPDATRQQALRDLQDDLNLYAGQAEQHDNDLKQKINGARDGLRAAFTSTTTLGTDQGRNDAQQLATDPAGLTPEQYQRLNAAGQLTPEQLNALRAGDTATIPASQMEYLNQIGRSLDGKSPQEIQQMMDKLPPDARQSMANAFQIMSNPKVTASVGDANLPQNGGLNVLPKKMQESLTRPDLVSHDSSAVSYNPVRDPLAVGVNVKNTHLNGVADNQAIAKIAGMSDARYQMGSDLDKKVLDVGAQYLHAEQTWDKNPGHIGSADVSVDGQPLYGGQRVSEDMFASVGGDKIAVQELVGPPNSPNSQFLHDAFTNNWADHGKAVSALFNFDDHDSVVSDPGDRAQIQAATRQGNIMSAVGNFMSTDQNFADLSNMSNGYQTSVGQMNPDLIRSVSHSMTPYINTLAGGEDPGTLGFKTDHWVDPRNQGDYHGAKNIFTLMNTDKVAGIEFNGRAMADELVDENQFAQNPNSPHSTHPLETAGRLVGLEDAGIRDSTQIRFDGEHSQAQAEYQRKSEAFDYTKKLLGLGIDKLPDGDKDIVKDLPGVPYGDLKDPASNLNKVVDMGGDPLKEMFTGPKPGDADTATIAGRDFKEQQYQVLAGTQLPSSVQNDTHFSNLFENGQLKSWDKMSNTDKSDLTQLFNQSFQNIGINQDSMESVYRPIVETDPSVKPPKKG